MSRLSRRALLGASAALAFATHARGDEPLRHQGTPVPSNLGPEIPPESANASGNWPMANGDYSSTRSAIDSTIAAATLGHLTIGWDWPVTAESGYGGMTAAPIVIGDVVFLQDMLSNVSAVDLATGITRWTHIQDDPSIGPNGVAVGYGLVIAATGSTCELFALDALSGREVWRARLSNNPAEGIDMAPALWDSTVYVSTVAGNVNSFNVGGARGVLHAIDAATGATRWSFDTTANLWGNPAVNSGGGLWYPPSIDADGVLYFGVANAAPWPGTPDAPNASSRPGANDYASCMVAMDGRSGEVRWSYNAAPHDLFDHDFQNAPVLAEAEVGDERRALAIGSGKTGTVIAVDRLTGEVVWSARVGKHQQDDLPEIPAGERVDVLPGAWGGVLTPPALDGDLLVVPVVNLATTYGADGYDHRSMFDFSRGTGELVALDTGNGQVRWSTPLPSLPLSGVTIANDLVFVGALDGTLRAFSLSSGDEQWRVDTGYGINAPVTIAGDALVFAAAGWKVASAVDHFITQTVRLMRLG